MINQRYTIKKKLGQGRSSVYLCTDSEIPEKDQAIKILSPDASPEEVESFKSEYFILRKLNHPNIIKSNEFGTVVKVDSEFKEISVGSKFLTMEFFNGVELIKHGKIKDEKVLLEVIKQLCSVLYYLHQSNYIYYDLKKENILINEISGKPAIKLIDLGFAEYIPDVKGHILKGTAEYIAPELLRNERHDHRVDLYSFGILLYRIIYGTFPFKAKNEMEIYKAHLEENYDFPASSYSEKLIYTIKKLLAKNPEERFLNALEVLGALDINIDEDLIKDWIPVSSFSSRKDIVTIVDTYLADNHGGEIFVLKGSEGSGKTTLLNEICAKYNNCIYINDNKSGANKEFIKFIFKKIIYNDFVYGNLSKEDILRSEKFIDEEQTNLSNDLKSILNKITAECNFTLLLDGFNLYDDYTHAILKNIFPILQVNGIKIILSENTDLADRTDIINNLREIHLTPFTDSQLSEYIERNFYPLFPSEDLRKSILQYADLLPGNIIDFIKDLILLKLIQFSPEGVLIKSDKRTDYLLKSSHEEIYKLRIKKLTAEELTLANLLSSFESTLDRESISVLMEMSMDRLNLILNGLQYKNIIQRLTLVSDPVFTTQGLKRFIYSNIQDKEDFHRGLVKKIGNKLPQFNQMELSRHYEIIGNYYESYLILREEIFNAEKISAFSYQKKLLSHLLEIPLSNKIKTELNLNLCNVLYQMGDYKSSLELIENTGKETNDKAKLLDLAILKGSCLMGLGEYEKGKGHLNSILPSINDNKIKQHLLVDIANAEFEMNKYSEASSLCKQIIENEDSSGADKGKCYNFLGLIDIYRDNNLDGALDHFEKAEKIYEKSDLKLRVAQMTMNIGNIYNIKSDRNLAMEYWNKSLELNKSIGNLDQEAKLLASFAILNHDDNEYEKAIEIYLRAYTIFLSLGNKSGEGLAQVNLGVNYLMICEYQKAIDSLNYARSILESLQNYNEFFEALFLLCKTNYMVGDFKTFKQLMNEFYEKLKKTQTTDKHRCNYEYLAILSEQNPGNEETVLNKLDMILNEYLKQEEDINYFSALILRVKILIHLGKFQNGLDELNSEGFVNQCKKNPYFEGERLYFMGIISSSVNGIEGLKPAIEYFLKAYDIIKDLYVTELTWKVLFALTINYAERGNSNRAKTFLIYTKSVLDYISEKISDPRLKLLYSDQPERHTALETLNKLTENL